VPSDSLQAAIAFAAAMSRCSLEEDVSGAYQLGTRCSSLEVDRSGDADQREACVSADAHNPIYSTKIHR